MGFLKTNKQTKYNINIVLKKEEIQNMNKILSSDFNLLEHEKTVG